MALGFLKRKTKDIGQYYRERVAEQRGARVLRGSEASAMIERAERSGENKSHRHIGSSFVGGVRSTHRALRSESVQNVRRGGSGFLDIGGLSPGSDRFNFANTFPYLAAPKRSASHKRKKHKTPQALPGYILISTGQPQRQLQTKRHRRHNQRRTGSILDNFPSLQ